MAGGDHASSVAEAELRRGFETLAVAQPDPSAAVYEVRLNRPAQRNALSPAAFAEIPRAMALLDRLNRSPPPPRAPIPRPPTEGLRRAILEMQAALKRSRGAGSRSSPRCTAPASAAASTSSPPATYGTAPGRDVRGQGGGYGHRRRSRHAAAPPADHRVRQRRRTRAHRPQDHRHGGHGDGAGDQGVQFQARVGCRRCKDRRRDVTVEQGLEHVATWNAGMLRSNDLKKAIKAFLEKRKPVFSKL